MPPRRILCKSKRRWKERQKDGGEQRPCKKPRNAKADQFQNPSSSGKISEGLDGSGQHTNSAEINPQDEKLQQEIEKNLQKEMLQKQDEKEVKYQSKIMKLKEKEGNHDAEKRKLKENEMILDAEKVKLEAKEAKLEEKEAKLEEKEAKLEEKIMKLEEKEAKLEEKEMVLDAEKVKLEEKEKELLQRIPKEKEMKDIYIKQLDFVHVQLSKIADEKMKIRDEKMKKSDEKIAIQSTLTQLVIQQKPYDGVMQKKDYKVNLDLLLEFVKSWKSAPRENNVICVNGITNPFTLMTKTSLYIRKCYRSLYCLIKKKKQTINLLYGVKGIGKTYFFLYVLWRVLKSRKVGQVMLWMPWTSDNFSIVLRLTGDNIEPTDDVKLAADGSTSWFLSDLGICKDKHSVPLHLFRFGYPRCLVVVSDGMKDVLSTLDSFSNTEWILPTWEPVGFTTKNINTDEDDENRCFDELYNELPEEFREMYESCYQDTIAKDELVTYIYTVGLIPRSLFVLSCQEVCNRAERLLTNTSVETIFCCLTDAKFKYASIPSQLLCYTSEGPQFSVAEDFHFVSSAIAKLFYNKMEKQQREKMNGFMRMIQTCTQAGSLRGQLYEQIVHSKIARGRICEKAKCVSNGSDSDAPTFSLPKPNEVRYFDSITEATTSNVYYIPNNSKFVAIDSLTWTSVQPSDSTVRKAMVYILQITIDNDHKIHSSLQKHIQSLGDLLSKQGFQDIEYYFCFIVPKDRYEGMHFQQYVDKKHCVLRKVPSILKCIPQYVLLYSDLIEE